MKMHEFQVNVCDPECRECLLEHNKLCEDNEKVVEDMNAGLGNGVVKGIIGRF